MIQSAMNGEAVRMTSGKAEAKVVGTQRVQIIAPPAWVDRVEEWRGAQRPIPSLSAAVRMLVDIALASDGSTGKGTSRSKV